MKGPVKLTSLDVLLANMHYNPTSKINVLFCVYDSMTSGQHLFFPEGSVT